MRNIPEVYKNRFVSPQLESLYKNFEYYSNVRFLQKLFGFDILHLTTFTRDAYNWANKLNGDGLNVVVASLPSFCGVCYMIIKVEDRIKAAEYGLNINYA